MSFGQRSVPLIPPRRSLDTARPRTRPDPRRANPGLLALAVKLVKSVKFLLILASFAAYAFLMSWQASLVLVLAICCHEYGHVWAMRRRGVPTRGFYLIPFLGGLAVSSQPFGNRSEEAFIASMGPVFGLATAPLCFVLAFLVTGAIPTAATITSFVVFVNLFNMLPIVPMDGGRILRACVASFNRQAGVAIVFGGLAAAVLMAAAFHLWILVWVAVLAAFEVHAERRYRGNIGPLPKSAAFGWIAAYSGIVAAAVLLMAVCDRISGGPSLLGLLHQF